MSDLLLPSRSLVLASLLRPTHGPGRVGLVNIMTFTSVPAALVAQALAVRSGQLLEAQPELLLPGPPVCFTLTFVLPNGTAFTSMHGWDVERALARDDLAGMVCGSLAHIVDATFVNARDGLYPPIVNGNAPSPTTVQ